VLRLHQCDGSVTVAALHQRPPEQSAMAAALRRGLLPLCRRPRPCVATLLLKNRLFSAPRCMLSYEQGNTWRVIAKEDFPLNRPPALGYCKSSLSSLCLAQCEPIHPWTDCLAARRPQT
jgi:hypothetical protein